MKLVHRAALVLALLLVTRPAAAAQPGFAFLEVPGGARAAAMGGAFATVAKGAEAAFWNPAGLALASGTELSATHTETYEQLRHEHVAVAGKLFGGGLAASFRALYSEPIEERDDLGNLVGTFGAHDLEFLAGYGRTLAGGTSVGLAAQVVRERIADLAATTWGVTAGTAFGVPLIPGGRASVSIHNVGPAAHYILDGVQGQAVHLPTAVHVGISTSRTAFQNFTGLLAVEARATRGRQALVSVGGEIDSPAGAALRMGIRAGDDVASWSAGAGWRAQKLSVDYAFVPSKLDLDDTHRFSLTARF